MEIMSKANQDFKDFCMREKLTNDQLIEMIISKAIFNIQLGDDNGDDFRMRDFYESNKNNYDFSEITVKDEVLESIYRAEF